MKRRQEAEEKRRAQFDVDIVKSHESEQSRRQQWDDMDRQVSVYICICV